MGLFDLRPYKMNDLTIAEDAAVCAALEVSIDSGADRALGGKLSKAYRHYKKGSVSRDDLSAIIAAVAASLNSLKDDLDDMRTTTLKQKGVAVLALAMALDKLMNKLR